MGLSERFKGGFFKALIQDARANTIAIAAAALLPLVAMVGGGIDASRFYMAQSRLQAACDAGALAARRAMNDDTFKNKHRKVGRAFFDENFPEGTFGVQDRTRTYQGTNDGEVVGTASGIIPTSLMSIFGFGEFELNASCTADINISNTDVMFVLDVTGSMQGSPLQGLQQASKDFYQTVEDATSSSAQVRYGFVPYNSMVNVGKVIYAEDPSFLATQHTYSSREPLFTITWDEISLDTDDGYYNEGPSQYQYFSTTAAGNVSESFCAQVYPQYADGFDPFVIQDTLDLSTGTIDSQSENGDIRTTIGRGAQIRLRFGVAGYTYNNGYCRVGNEVYERTAEVDYTLIEERSEEFDAYRYYARSFDLTDLYDDDRVTFNTGINGTNVTHFWDGCIEESGTSEGQTDFTTIPSDAYDLNINIVPGSNDERWKPALPSLIHYRYTAEEYSAWTKNERVTNENWDDTPSYTCPREAQRLQELSQQEFDTYIDSLTAQGWTYHDAGMIWGARFISPKGIFANENTTAPNGEAISRHIVFMTDGEQRTRRDIYARYGIEFWDRRVSGNGNGGRQSNAHAERFQAACRAARNENISVWVVAFGIELTQNLVDCASPGRAYEAANSDELSDAFKEIAEKIAALRLTA